MKTISPKDASKLFLFLLILFSAKTFSHPKLPNDTNSSDCETRMGNVKKTTMISTNAMQSKNNAALKSNATSKVKMKIAVSK